MLPRWDKLDGISSSLRRSPGGPGSREGIRGVALAVTGAGTTDEPDDRDRDEDVGDQENRDKRGRQLQLDIYGELMDSVYLYDRW